MVRVYSWACCCSASAAVATLCAETGSELVSLSSAPAAIDFCAGAVSPLGAAARTARGAAPARADAARVFEACADAAWWFEAELGFGFGFANPAGTASAAYCGVGASNVAGRAIAESAYRAMLYAGVPVTGFRADAAPGAGNQRYTPIKNSRCRHV